LPGLLSRRDGAGKIRGGVFQKNFSITGIGVQFLAEEAYNFTK
jgi:hypothetical protein